MKKWATLFDLSNKKYSCGETCTDPVRIETPNVRAQKSETFLRTRKP